MGGASAPDLWPDENEILKVDKGVVRPEISLLVNQAAPSCISRAWSASSKRQATSHKPQATGSEPRLNQL